MKNFYKFFLNPISAILTIYIIYKSEFVWYGSRRDYYFNYFIFSSSLFIVSLIVIFLSENFKIYFLIILISTIITLYTYEAYLIKNYTWKNLYKRIEYYEKNTGKKFDNRKRLEIYNDLKNLNLNTSIIVPPKEYLNLKLKIFPFSGISNSQTIHGNESGYYSIYKSDRYGFNNPDYEWIKNNDYILIGDSYTHGAYVNRPNDIASKLRHFSKKSVLNLGYSGTGPLIQLGTMREYLPKKSKNVIWLFYEGNDLIELNRELNSSFLNKYLIDKKFKQNLILKQSKINKITQETITKSEDKLNKNSKLKSFYRFITINLTRKTLFNNKYPLKDFKKIVSLAKEFAKKNNSNFYFVYLPEFDRYKIKNYQNYQKNEVKKIIEELNIDFIDVDKEVFLIENSPLKLFPFESRGHYNELGYEKVAELIFNKVK